MLVNEAIERFEEFRGRRIDLEGPIARTNKHLWMTGTTEEGCADPDLAHGILVKQPGLAICGTMRRSAPVRFPWLPWGATTGILVECDVLQDFRVMLVDVNRYGEADARDGQIHFMDVSKLSRISVEDVRDLVSDKISVSDFEAGVATVAKLVDLRQSW